ncbi:Uncharacterized protein Fot_32735 [Forsythia ovata]|uniref:Uncharacterized protein n=1 Tax=Forsythia ovata TaxID=205694 RepID=A0ABD1T975_9LAMI
MLGTLPTFNLRARDFEEWAKLCNEMLIDPVYNDAIEWECAEKILNGNILGISTLPANGNQNEVSELLEINERFGWDNEDKAGWGKIDFGLLGSSKGGRIPRMGGQIRNVEKKMKKLKTNEETSDKGDGERRRMEGRERERLGSKMLELLRFVIFIFVFTCCYGGRIRWCAAIAIVRHAVAIGICSGACKGSGGGDGIYGCSLVGVSISASAMLVVLLRRFSSHHPFSS